MTSSAANGESQPVSEPDGGELLAVGLWLRRQREIREIDIEDIAAATKISKRYLTAIEDGRFDQLPGPIFVRGFLRQYAAYTGLDPDEAFNNFLAAQQADEQAAEPVGDKTRVRGSSGRGRLVLWIVIAVVALAAMIVVAGSFLVGRSKSPPPRTEAGPLPVAVPPPVAAAPVEIVPAAPEPASSPLQVTLDFLDDCWVEAVIDGGRTLSEVRVQGESLQLEAREKIVLTVDKVQAVQVEVNGEPYLLVADAESEGAQAVEIVAPAAESAVELE